MARGATESDGLRAHSARHSAVRRDALLATLAESRGRALVGYAFLFTGELRAAEDLAQEALVKAMLRTRAGVELSSTTSAEAYVRRTIASLYVDGYRRHRRWLALVPTIAERDTPEHAHGPATDPSLVDLDLRDALATLPRQERACVVLRYYEDLTVAQIAEALGVAQGTVKRYLSQGLGRLGEIVTDEADDDVEITWRKR